MLVGSPPEEGKTEAGTMAGVLRSSLTGFGLEESAEPAPEEGLLARIGTRSSLQGAKGALEEADPDQPAPLQIVVDAAASERSAPTPPPSGKSGAPHPVALLAPDAHDAAAVGTAWHHLMEQVEWIESWEADGGLDDRALVAILRAAMPEATLAWCEERVTAFRSALAFPEVRRALSKAVLGGEKPACVRREWRWLGPGPGDAPVEGVIDRVVLSGGAEGSERALIIDWKSDCVPPGGHAVHAERYRNQMASYRAAVAGLEGLDPHAIETRLVFLRDGVSVDLGGEGGVARSGG